MPREFWAKLHVELLDDGKLYERSDSDFRLWVSLILLAKMTTEDGVLRGMGADSLRKRFNLDCSAVKVQGALDHFAKHEMLSVEADGSIRIINYEKRQAVMDKQERNAARQRKWYADHNKPNAQPNGEPNGNLTTEEKRVEEKRVEEKRTEENRSPLSPPKGGPYTRLRRGFQNPLPEKPKWQSAGYSSPEEYATAHAEQLADAKKELE